MISHGLTTAIIGISASLSTVTGAFQSLEHSSDFQKTSDKNAFGDTVLKTWTDLTEEKATFEYITTTKPPTIPSGGAMITIADPDDTSITGANWTVDGWNKSLSNDGHAMKVKLELSRNANITS
jgi:hypothetical protein